MKVLVFLVTFFKNFVRKTGEKIFAKENVTVVEITSIWSSDISRSSNRSEAVTVEVSTTTEDLRILYKLKLSVSSRCPGGGSKDSFP